MKELLLVSWNSRLHTPSPEPHTRHGRWCEGEGCWGPAGYRVGRRSSTGQEWHTLHTLDSAGWMWQSLSGPLHTDTSNLNALWLTLCIYISIFLQSTTGKCGWIRNPPKVSVEVRGQWGYKHWAAAAPTCHPLLHPALLHRAPHKDTLVFHNLGTCQATVGLAESIVITCPTWITSIVPEAQTDTDKLIKSSWMEWMCCVDKMCCWLLLMVLHDDMTYRKLQCVQL